MRHQHGSPKAAGERGWRPLPKPAVRAQIEGTGRRLTPQREAVYEYLRGVDHHPTAEEVYLAVKERLPRVSLATVYKSLELLVASGLASKFTYGNASARYDRRTDVHSHARCLTCGRVDDLDVVPDERWLASLRVPDFHATGFRFELVGECGGCRRGRRPA